MGQSETERIAKLSDSQLEVEFLRLDGARRSTLGDSVYEWLCTELANRGYLRFDREQFRYVLTEKPWPSDKEKVDLR